jgi:hypothetical protein
MLKSIGKYFDMCKKDSSESQPPCYKRKVLNRVGNQLRVVEKMAMRMAIGQREASNKNNGNMVKKGGSPRIVVLTDRVLPLHA